MVKVDCANYYLKRTRTKLLNKKNYDIKKSIKDNSWLTSMLINLWIWDVNHLQS